jgi:pimeloyl-ACP methyl ester carboxylesterase
MAVPALLIVGRYDVICGIRWARDLNELIPGSQLLVLENSGHFGHVEEPGLFADAIAEFVTALSR